MTDRALVDTGPIVAILSPSDQHHQVCVEQLGHMRGPLITCWPVITEASWLLRKRPAAVAMLLSALDDKPFALAELGQEDLPPMSQILLKYRSLEIQLADAALVHLAHREKIDTIFTLDRRDFGVLRATHGRKLRIVP